MTTRIIDTDYDWMELAACRGADPDLFFASDTEKGRDTYAPARAICLTCSVRKDCYNYAMRNRIVFGMWGGLSPVERGHHHQ